ncbi:MAG: serine/threonine-protein kinase, partial [Planctomycetia bacterium]
GADGIARSFEPGEAIGDFTLVRFLGHGGMGQVWEARQVSMRRPVALKFILPGRADERMIALFEREARAGGRANHPNLVRTLARGTTEGIEWIAQELVEGSFSLRDAIERFRREPALPKDYYRRCASLVQAIAQGLQAAHEAGVIHRDLKPQNILLDSRDTPRVLDFGLARIEGDTVLSKSGDVAGTFQYMSPEQVSGARSQIDHRTDVFSLGVVLYELLTLQRPFTGDTTQQIAAQIALFDPPEPSVLRAQCPRDLSVIVLKALEKRPAARYATMREFAEDIGRYLRHEPIRARPASKLESARKWVMRNPGPSVGIGVGAVALVVISGVAVVALNQAQRAERGEQLAKDNAETAQRNAETAERNANDATQKANDVLSLSAQKDYEDLMAAAEKLWPADSTMVSRYEDWLAKARELINGRPADDSKQQKKRPSLVEHKAKLA